jgi:hypothetical protein
MDASHSNAGMGPRSAQPMRYEFRHWLRRTVPFTRLGTPRTEAVLGLDQTGSYSITLGDLDVPGEDAGCDHHDGGTYDRSGSQNLSRACLALRMYGTWVELARDHSLTSPDSPPDAPRPPGQEFPALPPFSSAETDPTSHREESRVRC